MACHGRWMAAGILSFAALQAYGQAVKPAVQRIDIESGWGGLNPDMPFQSRLVIVRDGSTYRLTGGHSKGHNGKPQPEQAFPATDVPIAQVAHLVDAMGMPAQSQVDLSTLQPAIKDVQEKIDKVLVATKISTLPGDLGTKVRAWRESLRDPKVLAEALTKGFDATHTDDYPHIKITVTLGDGKTLSARSGSQHYLMLPWVNARGDRTYSPAIAQALDTLLPKDTTNKERLEGTLDDGDLDEVLSAGLDDPIGRFQAQAEAPDAVHLLEANFKVQSLSVMHWEGRHLDIILQQLQGPPNLLLTTRLRLAGSTLASGADIPAMRQQLRLAQTSPVLAARMASMPQTDFRIHYNFGWTWLNRQTASQFVQQMQSMKKLPELKSRPELMRGAVMVQEGRLPLYWIVLSDGRTVLWKQPYSPSVPTVGKKCPSIPIADEQPNIDDVCFGEVYGSDGNAK